MTRYLLTALLLIILTSYSSAQLKLSFKYDVKNQLTEFTVQELYKAKVEYDESGNRIGVFTEEVTLVNKVLEPGDVQIWPNPFNEELFVALGETEKVTKIIMLNAMGQIVFEKQGVLSGIVKLQQLTDFPEGMYVLKLTSGNDEFIFKLIKV